MNLKYLNYIAFALLIILMIIFHPNAVYYQRPIYTVVIINDIVILLILILIQRDITILTVAVLLVAFLNAIIFFNVDPSVSNLRPIFFGLGIWGNSPGAPGVTPAYNHVFILYENFMFLVALTLIYANKKRMI